MPRRTLTVPGHIGELNDFEQAIADCTEAIRLDPCFAIAYYRRAYAYWRKGEYDQAIADYTRNHSPGDGNHSPGAEQRQRL